MERLENLVMNADKSDCADYFEPLSRVFIDQRPINLCDPVLCKFMEVVEMRLENRRSSFNDIFNKLTWWNSNNRLGPATYDCPDLDGLFDLRSSDAGWHELDRVLNYFAGVTLSEAADGPPILHSADDPGLHGDVCFGAVVQTRNPRTGVSKRKWVAIASSADRIVPLAILAARIEQETFNKWTLIGEGHPDYDRNTKRVQGEPISVEIRKNGKQHLSFPIIGERTSGIVEPNWRAIEVRVEDMSMLNALLPVVSEDTKHYVKGQFLQGQLGL
jgi:hypothetical protein